MAILVSFDLETTGFEADKDKIIEIAALKFDGEKIIDRFESLINPEIPIPAIITHITGIHQKDLANAPKFNEVSSKLLEFLSDHPIVGHNIEFDVNFLRKKGLTIAGPLYDTFQLAPILLPDLASYSLETLTRILKIPHEDKHRAMSDAKACQELFLILETKITEINPEIFEEIKNILEKSTWCLKDFFIKTKVNSVKSKNKINNISPSNFISNDSKISKKILEGFYENKNFIMEIDPGIDKISAYLSSSLSFASEKEKVVIATYNKNIQNQILKNIYKENDITILKEENIYISLTRFELLKQKSHFEDYEAIFIIKVLLWLNRTQSGDLSELTIYGKEYEMLNEINCQENFCNHQKDECFAKTAFERAEKSNVLIVDQSMLFKDYNLIKNCNYLIIDEAHNLQKTATYWETITISLNPFLKPFKKLENSFAENNIPQDLQSIIPKIEIFFGLLGIYLEKSLSPEEFQYCKILKRNEGGEYLEKILASGKSILEVGENIIQSFQNQQELKFIICQCLENLENLKNILENEQKDNQIIWIYKTKEESISLRSAPLNIGESLKNIFQNKKSIVLVSSALTIENSFNFIKEELGIGKNFEEIIIHDAIETKAKIIIPEDLPAPNTEGHFLNSTEIIEKTIIKNKGKTLVLFTSKKALKAAFQKIAPSLKKEGFTVLGHGVSGGQGKILEHFKEETETSAIFCLSSFWEKVEIEKMDCLIIQKLPFEPPSEPLIESRGKKYEDDFSEYQLPLAILNFKNDFQKLIKNKKTHYNILILDTRIIKKKYGEKFLKSLPPGIEIEHVSKEKLV